MRPPLSHGWPSILLSFYDGLVSNRSSLTFYHLGRKPDTVRQNLSASIYVTNRPNVDGASVIDPQQII
jgi:hypothetical protein